MHGEAMPVPDEDAGQQSRRAKFVQREPYSNPALTKNNLGKSQSSLNQKMVDSVSRPSIFFDPSGLFQKIGSRGQFLVP
jgi:hypothetical protein